MALANAGLLIDFFGRPIWKDGSEILVRENIGGEVCGNTVSATIPIALKSAWREKRLKAGSRVLLAGFGVGLSWAGCLLEWNDQHESLE